VKTLFASMKAPRVIATIGVRTGTLFLSGCMAAMIPAMLLGHAAHKKGRIAHGQSVTTCDCENPIAPNTDAPAAPVAPADESLAPTQNSLHAH
jgi:hypothetical protein